MNAYERLINVALQSDTIDWKFDKVVSTGEVVGVLMMGQSELWPILLDLLVDSMPLTESGKREVHVAGQHVGYAETGFYVLRVQFLDSVSVEDFISLVREIRR